MPKESNYNIRHFLKKEVKVLYYLMFAFFFIGYAVDLIFNYNVLPTHIIYADIFAMVVLVIVFLFERGKVISIQIAYLIILYTSILSLIAAYSYSVYLGIFNARTIFQDLIIIPPIIFATGFIVNKRNMLAIGIIFLLSYPTLMFLSKDDLLVSSATFIALMIIGATIAMMFFTGILEKSLKRNDTALREIRKQKNDLEKLNQQRTEVFSIIAHDLRNPMGNAVNVASLLLEDDLPTEEKKELIRVIFGMNKRAYELLENLLAWARLEKDTFNIKLENVNLFNSAQKAIDIFKINIDNKRLKITNNINRKFYIYSDKIVTETTFRNLISNAIKFTEEGGEIILDVYENKGNITFTVQDNGLGIPVQKLTSLLDTNETTIPGYGTRNEKGTGLGLKLTKSLIEKANGTIKVVSREGEGTTFYITFPKAKGKSFKTNG